MIGHEYRSDSHPVDRINELEAEVELCDRILSATNETATDICHLLNVTLLSDAPLAIHELQQEVAALRKQAEHWEETCHSQWDNYQDVIISALHKEVAELRRDADRYRWMSRDLLSRYDKKDKSYCLEWDHRGKCSGESEEWSDIDEVIDDAMKEETK